MGTVSEVITFAVAAMQLVIIPMSVFSFMITLAITRHVSSHHASVLRISGGVGNDLDFPASNKNQYEVEMLTSMRFKLPVYPVLDFNQNYRRALDAGILYGIKHWSREDSG